MLHILYTCRICRIYTFNKLPTSTNPWKEFYFLEELQFQLLNFSKCNPFLSENMGGNIETLTPKVWPFLQGYPQRMRL